MPRLMFRLPLLITALVLIAPAPRAAAQSSPSLKVLNPEDLTFWKTIRFPTVSYDGKLFAYQLNPNEGDAEVVLRPTGDGAERRFAIGEPPTAGGGFNPAAESPVLLSGDAKWLALTKYPMAAEAKRLRKERRPLQNAVVIVNTATGEKREFERVRRFVFAGVRPTWLVMHRYSDTPSSSAGAQGGDTPRTAPAPTGADLLLLHLATGTISHIGDVGEFGVDESGEWLAWTVETRDQVGNGIFARNLKSDVVRTLDSDKRLYRRLAWADSGLALAALRGRPDSIASDTAYTLLGFVGFNATAGVRKIEFTLADTTSGALGMRISAARAPQWAIDQSSIAFGIQSRRASPESTTPRPDVRPVAGIPGAMQAPGGAGSNDDDLPTLVIWHGKEPRLQSMQQVQENQDRQFSYLSLYRIAEQRFIRLATDEVRDVVIAPRQKYAVGFDRRGYERRDNLDGGQRRDAYVIDLTTGERQLIARELRYSPQPSPDGARLLYYSDGHYHVYDFATKQTRNVTKGVATSFVNTEDDHNVDKPPTPAIGWSSDGQFVLLSDNWDVWKVPAVSGTAVNLTGNGKAERIRYRGRVVYDPRERGINLAKPQYVAMYGEWTKKQGLGRVVPNRAGVERLVWDDAQFTVRRARDVETFVFTRENVQTFPDYWVAEGSFATPRRLTDANPQQREFAWSSGTRLVNYVSEKGDSLQGALLLPANYEAGKRYPTVVYIYEKLSQQLHTYAVPNETRAFNPSVFTSRGYAVFMPDIVYKINDPGMSAVWCVVPAVKAAIATGIVDSTKVGLHGHSWGGYQSAFLATQTGKLFRGIVSGAPLTDMISMYSSVYWNTGSANQPIFEASQGRFKGNFLENTEAYIRNSPAFFADKVKTSVMLLHNEKDGAVDFNQGITFFNTLRELNKDVILLQYVGENHGLATPKNQKDYTTRMKEYFDHYLTGAPAPDWIREGIPRLKMEEHLKNRLKKPKVAS